jgi:hypothetical protein
MIEDYEKDYGLLTWQQRTNIIAQFEEELFNNYDHLKRLEDVLDDLEQRYGFYKKVKKEISIEWVDKEIKRAREMYIIHSPEEIKRQREFIEKYGQEHKKFIQIGRCNFIFNFKTMKRKMSSCYQKIMRKN